VSKDFTCDAHLCKPWVKTFDCDALLQKQTTLKEFTCGAVLFPTAFASTVGRISFAAKAYLVDRVKDGYKHMGSWQDPENMGVWKGGSWVFGQLDATGQTNPLLTADRSQGHASTCTVSFNSYLTGTPGSESFLSGNVNSHVKFSGTPGGYIRGT